MINSVQDSLVSSQESISRNQLLVMCHLFIDWFAQHQGGTTFLMWDCQMENARKEKTERKKRGQWCADDGVLSVMHSD